MRISLIICLAFLVNLCTAQDVLYAKKTVDTLTSPYFWGRGYTNNGMKKAADFLVKEFEALGVKPLDGKNFLQDYSYAINTFPGMMEVELNGLRLEPGKDFIVSPESRGVKTKGKLIQKDSTHFIDSENALVVSLEKKLTWTTSQEVADYTSIKINKNSIKEKPSNINVHIENKHIADFKASNVCGIVKGTTKPDSILFITAHYDHLGGMGADTYFPGANDNASGISLLLDLAKYYTKNPPSYSVAFICFSGEEAGLLGSKYFSEHPLVDLHSVRFLINLDLTGTGDEGITVVNATEFKKEFSFLKEINQKGNYLVKVNPRGKAANSDHYWFSQKNIPSFFIYTMGGIKAYHDVYDVASTLPLTSFENLFKLIVDFNSRLMEN